MLHFKDILPLTKMKLFTNIIVFVFIYIFLKPSTKTNTINHKDYHTHCLKTTSIYEESQYIDLESELEINKHIHPSAVRYNVKGHSHNSESEKIPKPKTIEDYKKDNIYVAKYDRPLEYLLKAFVILTVITSMVVFNVAIAF
jgi:hypothetical protein